MESDKLKQIAEQSGTTVSTVRRVLGHCAGISSETRKSVIGAQCALKHVVEQGDRRAYCILPDNPKAFWHKAVDVLNGHPFFPSLKLSFYSSLQQSSTLTAYLQPLLDVTETVLILGASLNNEQRSLVEQITQNNLVIQLCEDSNVQGALYVGCDAYADGYALGEWASSNASRVGILQNPTNHNVCERIRGFKDALGEVPYVLVDEPAEKQLYASHLARSLYAVSPQPDLLFCPGGNALEVCQAVHKLRAPSLKYILWESTLQQPQLIATVRQPLAEQMRTALQLATSFLANGTYPEQNRYITPSKITYTT